MRSLGSHLIPVSLIVLILTAACGGPPKEKTVYWRGDMWDGMNRMVFALQDLGWHVDTVDTDTGVILASRGRDNSDRGDTAGGGHEAAGDLGPGKVGTTESSRDDFYRILVQFSEDPDTPVTIGPEEPGDETYSSSKFLRMISKITKRFEWYGGSSVEVIG